MTTVCGGDLERLERVGSGIYVGPVGGGTGSIVVAGAGTGYGCIPDIMPGPGGRTVTG